MKEIQGWIDEDVREETVNMAGGVGVNMRETQCIELSKN